MYIFKFAMYNMNILNVILVPFFISNVLGEYSVRLVGDTVAVLGGTLRLRAEVLDSSGNFAQGQFKYFWEDNAIPVHAYTKESTNPICEWNLSYDRTLYGPGPYNVQVNVEKKDWLGFYEDVASQRAAIRVTSLLTGDLIVTQGEALRQQYVATTFTAKHNITLNEADSAYLAEDGSIINTYWFFDCEYMGAESGLLHNFNYSGIDTTHYVEALVVASPMPATTTTTTTSTTSTTTTTTTTLKPPTTTAVPSTTLPNVTESVTIPSTHSEDNPLLNWINGFPKKNLSSSSDSGFCINMTTIPLSPNNTYGYFKKKLVAKAPARLLNITGSNWLKNGDMLNLRLNCNGSAPFSYCVQLTNGEYNVTGNETCAKDKAKVLNDCSLIFQHFFHVPEQYTLVFIISNSVSKLITPVGVNVYKVTKQPQLSVIIVPVASSIVAVVLIIFGVAYYIHSKRSYNVEVADFDFGQQHSELEYKTFSERLRESIINSFFRTNDPEDSESGWSPSRKYGSMQ